MGDHDRLHPMITIQVTRKHDKRNKCIHSSGVKANDRALFVVRPALLLARSPVLSVPWAAWLPCTVRFYESILMRSPQGSRLRALGGAPQVAPAQRVFELGFGKAVVLPVGQVSASASAATQMPFDGMGLPDHFNSNRMAA